MRVTYDPKYNIAYIRLGSTLARRLETIKLSGEVNVDVAANGKIYGFELLNARSQLSLIKGAKFVFTNALTGISAHLPPEV